MLDILSTAGTCVIDLGSLAIAGRCWGEPGTEEGLECQESSRLEVAVQVVLVGIQQELHQVVDRQQVLLRHEHVHRQLCGRFLPPSCVPSIPCGFP